MKDLHRKALNGKEVPLLDTSEKHFRYCERMRFGTRDRRLKRWYKIYLITTLSTVISVMLLLVVGVGANGKPIISSFTDIVDKIGNNFINLSFLNIDQTPKDDELEGNNNGVETIKPSSNPDTETNSPSTDVGADVKDIYDFDYSKVPSGKIPIIPMDLSLNSLGNLYINNSTGYKPDVDSLLKAKLGFDGGYEYMSSSQGPLVLIVHTHGTEAYCKDGEIYCEGDSNFARSQDVEKNVVSLGKEIAEILNKNGIATVHCTIMHDSVQYKDSYARAEESIKRYKEEYPTIKLVIDIHRDAIIKSSGEVVRPITQIDGETVSQIMCVVGSDWEGDDCDNWEKNLSLALKLKEKLNSVCTNLCRPVNLRSHTYNQELCEYSLLLEVGASGNSYSEAMRAATIIGNELCNLIKEMK